MKFQFSVNDLEYATTPVNFLIEYNGMILEEDNKPCILIKIESEDNMIDFTIDQNDLKKLVLLLNMFRRKLKG